MARATGVRRPESDRLGRHALRAAAGRAVSGGELSDHPVLALQRLAGNAAVATLVQSLGADGHVPGGSAVPGGAVLGAQLRAALAGRGAPLPRPALQRLEAGLGTDLADVRVHTGGTADSLSRSLHADAFTAGKDIFFRSGAYAPESPSGFRTLAHEATHVVQQSKGPVAGTEVAGGVAVSDPSDRFEQAAERSANRLAHGVHGDEPTAETPAGGGERAGALPVQRHSSWEHRLLGDVQPAEIYKLGAQKDILAHGEGTVALNGQGIMKADIQHVLEQEIERLRVWQTHEPRVTTPTGLRMATDALQQVDPTWQVRLVSIPDPKGQKPPLVMTYGELNTLADFYGSVNEMKATESDKLRAVVQSVRRQSFEQLFRLYGELMTGKAEPDKKEKSSLAENLGVDKLEFKGSHNITGNLGEGNQMFREKKGSTELVTSYGSTLARNACHFPPESWHSWQSYHAEALRLAHDAYTARQAGNNILADKVQNEALLNNGFGDHYLQDSYAAGHLINKTQVMQWYVEWVEQSGVNTYARDTTWRQFQAMTYLEPGLADPAQYNKAAIGTRNLNGVQVTTARNPQAVENTQELNDPNFGWQQRFQMLGLRTPPSVTAGSPALALLLWMQEQHGGLARSRYDVRWTWKELKEKARGSIPDIHSEDELTRGIEGLLADGVVFSKDESRQASGARLRGQAGVGNILQDDSAFELRKEYVVSVTGPNQGNFNLAAQQARQGNMGRYDKMMQATAYKDYVQFMHDSYIQKSTNALHNHYCVQGLDVVAADGHTVQKIYGDDHMLDAESSKGVAESATTSNWSRDSILAKAATDQEPPGKTTIDILNRLPDHVVLGVGQAPISLADWHNQGTLKNFAFQHVFPEMGAVLDRGLAGMVGLRGPKDPGSLGKITKDENVHGAEAF